MSFTRSYPQPIAATARSAAATDDRGPAMVISAASPSVDGRRLGVLGGGVKVGEYKGGSFGGAWIVGRIGEEVDGRHWKRSSSTPAFERFSSFSREKKLAFFMNF